MFIRKYKIPIVKDMAAMISQVIGFLNSLYKAPPTQLPTMLPRALPMVNSAEPLSFAPGFTPSESLTLWTSSSKMGTTTVPAAEPRRISETISMPIVSAPASPLHSSKFSLHLI